MLLDGILLESIFRDPFDVIHKKKIRWKIISVFLLHILHKALDPALQGGSERSSILKETI